AGGPRRPGGQGRARLPQPPMPLRRAHRERQARRPAQAGGAVILPLVLLAAPLGPCGDRASCTFKASDEVARHVLASLGLKSGDGYAIELQRGEREVLV